MLFCSLVFIFAFLPLVLALYYFANKKYRNIILCLASLQFYAWGEPKYIILMLVSIVANFFFAKSIAAQGKKARRKTFLIFAIIFNVGLLGFFKYFNFGISIFNGITGFGLTVPIIALPIGISFYTFQILSYVIDVYWGKVKVQKNIINLAMYISFFPQLIAGPIVQYKDIERELRERHESVELFTTGVKRFIIGLAKKIIIANNVAYIADTIYAQPLSQVSIAGYWLAALAYMLQIYYDFSGYSDMAIGLGKMFGFNFLENFNYPYIATSVTDFWRRWHISLSRWFRDYIYIPLGGNRCSKIKWIRNIMVVWALTGLWHGANWNFIIWGLYFGIILLIEKLFLSKIIEKLPVAARWFYTMFIVIISWVIFRVENLPQLLNVLGKMFGINGTSKLSQVFYSDFTLVTSLPYVIIGLLFMTPFIKNLSRYLRQKRLFFIPLHYLLYMAIFSISIVFLVSNSYNPFIYFRF